MREVKLREDLEALLEGRYDDGWFKAPILSPDERRRAARSVYTSGSDKEIPLCSPNPIGLLKKFRLEAKEFPEPLPYLCIKSSDPRYYYVAFYDPKLGVFVRWLALAHCVLCYMYRSSAFGSGDVGLLACELSLPEARLHEPIAELRKAQPYAPEWLIHVRRAHTGKGSGERPSAKLRTA